MQDQTVLVNILSTLHRLEAHFEDQNDRLSLIERSVSPDPDSGLHRSGSKWASRQISVNQMAAEYQASVAKIKHRFDFVDDSRSELNRSLDMTNDDGDWQSASVYSSRPQSRLRLELVPPPLAVPSHEYHSDRMPETIAVRYEDIVQSPVTISSRGGSISASQSSSVSTAPTSITHQEYRGEIVTFDAILDNNNNNNGSGNTVLLSHRDIAESIRRLIASLRMKARVWAEKAIHKLREQRRSVGQSTTRVAGSSWKAVRKAAEWVGRKMVDQQMKRLNVGA